MIKEMDDRMVDRQSGLVMGSESTFVSIPLSSDDSSDSNNSIHNNLFCDCGIINVNINK